MNAAEPSRRPRMPRRTLMVRLVGSFLVLSVLMVAAVGALAYLRARSTLQSIHLRSPRRSRRAEGRCGQQLGGRPAPQRRLRGDPFREHPVERRPAAEATLPAAPRHPAPPRPPENTLTTTMRALLDGVVSQTADAEEYLILDQNGLVRLSTTPTHEGASQGNERYFQDASSGITTVEPVRLSTLTKQPTITIATPLFNQDGQEIGELAGRPQPGAARLDRPPIHRARRIRPDLPRRLQQPLRRPAARHRAVSPAASIPEASMPGCARSDGHALYADYRGHAVIGSYRLAAGTGTALIAEMKPGSRLRARPQARPHHRRLRPARRRPPRHRDVPRFLAGSPSRSSRSPSTAEAVAAGDLDSRSPGDDEGRGREARGGVQHDDLAGYARRSKASSSASPSAPTSSRNRTSSSRRSTRHRSASCSASISRSSSPSLSTAPARC